MWKSASKHLLVGIIVLANLGCETESDGGKRVAHRDSAASHKKTKVEIVEPDQESTSPVTVSHVVEQLEQSPQPGTTVCTDAACTPSLNTNYADYLTDGAVGPGLVPDLPPPPFLDDFDYHLHHKKRIVTHGGHHKTVYPGNGSIVNLLVQATGQSPNGAHADQLIFVNATDGNVSIRIDYLLPFTNQNWDSVYRVLRPGDATVYNGFAASGDYRDFAFNIRPRQLFSFDLQVPELDEPVNLVTVAKPYGGLFVISKKNTGPAFTQYTATGPYYDRGAIGSSLGTLYMVNATGYTVNFHVGYLSIFCSSDDVKLLPYGQVKQLNIGGCFTNSVNATVLLPNGQTVTTPNFNGHANNGILVFREKIGFPGQFEVAGTFDLYN